MVAETDLEDLADNNLARLFEVDIFGLVQRRIEVKTVQVSFRIGKAHEGGR